VFGTEVAIVLRDGSQAKALTEGEVVVSGHNVMSGYWHAPAETEAAFSNGWLHTGDLGLFVELSGVRYFFITGRLKEIIIRHGETISPRAVEEEITELGALGRYAVCGFSNEAAGEEIGVYIQASDVERALAEAGAILARCSPRYRPRVAMIGSTALPATVTGKIQRKRLARCFVAFARTHFGTAPRVVRHEETEDSAYDAFDACG
jgi:long-chain acyl-CoA synthetase